MGDSFVCDADKSAAPDNGHAPVLWDIATSTINAAGQVFACFKDIEGCEPIWTRVVGFTHEGEGRVLSDDVAE